MTTDTEGSSRSAARDLRPGCGTPVRPRPARRRRRTGGSPQGRSPASWRPGRPHQMTRSIRERGSRVARHHHQSVHAVRPDPRRWCPRAASKRDQATCWQQRRGGRRDLSRGSSVRAGAGAGSPHLDRGTSARTRGTTSCAQAEAPCARSGRRAWNRRLGQAQRAAARVSGPAIGPRADYVPRGGPLVPTTSLRRGAAAHQACVGAHPPPGRLSPRRPEIVARGLASRRWIRTIVRMVENPGIHPARGDLRGCAGGADLRAAQGAHGSDDAGCRGGAGRRACRGRADGQGHGQGLAARRCVVGRRVSAARGPAPWAPRPCDAGLQHDRRAAGPWRSCVRSVRAVMTIVRRDGSLLVERVRRADPGAGSRPRTSGPFGGQAGGPWSVSVVDARRPGRLVRMNQNRKPPVNLRSRFFGRKNLARPYLARMLAWNPNQSFWPRTVVRTQRTVASNSAPLAARRDPERFTTAGERAV
jgi:hypothetical protein